MSKEEEEFKAKFNQQVNDFLEQDGVENVTEKLQKRSTSLGNHLT